MGRWAKLDRFGPEPARAPGFGYTAGVQEPPTTRAMAKLNILTALLLAAALSGCGLFPKDEDKTRNWTASKFYAEASGALAEGDYEEAIELYEKLEARYPFGRYATQAQLDLAYAYYRYGEPESALAALDRFIELHPTSPYLAYAYYMKGIVNFNRNLDFISRFLPTDTSQRDPGAAVDAFSDFAEVVNRFPDSEYAADARQRMVYLRNTLARHEVHVARYYMKRGAYVAAANRAEEVVEKYQRTPAVKDALQVMVEAYDKLGLEQLSADAQRVLAVNEAQGNFAEPPEFEPTVLGRIWNFLELDKN
jgi:outer membrane protein assembly factor BamD